MSDSGNATDHPREWPSGLTPYWIEQGELVDVALADDERPGRDSLGNAGHVRRVRETGVVAVQWPRSRGVRHLEGAGLGTLGDQKGESELHRAPRELPPEDVDPFLLEDSLRVLVQGRDFPGQQRAVLEAKAEALRRELGDSATAAERREQVLAMLQAMDDGLRATVRMQAVTRRFRPLVQLADACETIGSVAPVRVGSRIVYRVRSIDPETKQIVELAPDEGDGTMVFHVVALAPTEAVLLFIGDVHGLRHLADLELSAMHDAWFVNRERARTDATAPWLGRAPYRELREKGATHVVIHTRRDYEPVELRAVSEGSMPLLVAGERREVPVIECRTTKDDELTVLADPGSPLVLRLREAGAELLRTVGAILEPFGSAS